MTTHVGPRPVAPSVARGATFLPADLGGGVRAGFTGAAHGAADAAGRPGMGAVGNLAHRRPHVPARLADERARLAGNLGVEVDDLYFMRQVHGADVGRVGPATPRGAEVRGVDALVTAEVGRALCVQVADCVPVLIASSTGPVAAVHAGRRGVELGVVPSTLAALEDLGAPAATLRAAIGPAIGGCCYEVPAPMQREVAASHPAAAATTTWGTPSLNLPAAVADVLVRAGVSDVSPSPACTLCGDGPWFSHRGDPGAGRQVGVIVRHEAAR